MNQLPDFLVQRVDQSGGPDACWPWLLKRRYVNHKDESVRVARYAWESVHGPVADGYAVYHHCRNWRCCNPAHMFVAPYRALDERDVEEIRSAPNEWGVVARLAREYGVSHTTISKIRRGLRFKEAA